MTHCAADDLLADGMALGLVGGQQPVGGSALHSQRELPGQVDTVLDTGVHALGTGRRVDVGGVTSDEDAPLAVPLGQPVADPEH